MATIKFHDHWARPDWEATDLTVFTSGSLLTVAGPCKFEGADHTLDEEFTLTQRNVLTYLTGWVVKVISTGEIRLFVDELLADGFDSAYAFGDEGVYKPLFILFQAEVPANVSSFSNVDRVIVHRVLDRLARDAGDA